MKIILNCITAYLILFTMGSAYAQTAKPTEKVLVETTPAAVPTKTQEDEDVLGIKEKVASKVAELRKLSHKAVSGSITTVSSDKLTITSDNSKTYNVKIDTDLTKAFQVFGTQKKDIKLNSLKKADYVIITGPLTDKIIDANYIYKDEQFFSTSGKVTSIDKTNNQIDITATDKKSLTLDIISTTKIQLMDPKTSDMEKITLTKIKEGDSLNVIYKTAEEDNSIVTTVRILVIPQEFFTK